MSKQLHCRIDDILYDELVQYSNSNSLLISDCITAAIRRMLDRNKTKHPADERAYTFIDLFAGIGGMRLAFDSTGSRCVYTNEWNKFCQQTYNANFGDLPDGDITKVGDRYRMFYVSHDGGAGIKQAVSDRINGDYEYDPRWYDFEPRACEAPNLWKRIGEDKWVLMYDVYGINPHNFAFIETSDFVNFKNLGRFNEGVMKTTNFSSPKHGAVIHLTKEEAARLRSHWENRK